ncbi:dATP/dGTP diphosphohydrolase domain-containing protein [Asaia astilbis]|uniref:dATP/dGTP diphosphohydrolase domain-containing protein n=1 Tax=Asaia astilbis TaxID=610244 RepID=UPI000472D5D2|nr:dATP/dGTP diphosphohydrolase domain-containing protein [Asaia astilbis]
MIEGALRFNEGKLRFDLLPPDPVEELVAVLTMGAKKYSERNWEKGMSWMACQASLMRHLSAWMKGEDRDPESGRLHMAHVMWNAMAILTYQLRGIGTDDRPKIPTYVAT